jgi:asparagine synthetase B (glutamine-hydrolysing)
MTQQGWEGLAAELALDVGRLWRRNLGRDDRLIADVAREARHPFLDEAFIGALLALPLPAVADLRLPPGTGDKAVLRGALARCGSFGNPCVVPACHAPPLRRMKSVQTYCICRHVYSPSH